MILRDVTIKSRLSEIINLSKSDVSIDTNEILKQINPNSFDLTISGEYKRPVKVFDVATYGFRDKEEAEYYKSSFWVDCKSDNGYILFAPGDCVLAYTREYICMPKDLCGQIFSKSSLGRMFINHEMSGVIDSGFSGRLTLELKNDCIHYIRIPVGARVVQLYLMQLDGIPECAYDERNSKYMNAETVECAKWVG